LQAFAIKSCANNFDTILKKKRKKL
jgi:hypothetical protein